MKTIYVIILTSGITIIVYTLTLFLVQMYRKMKMLTKVLSTFPSPEEMARQILKVKLPINELPPELQKDLRDKVEKANKEQKRKSEEDLPTKKGNENSSYIG